MGIEGNYFNITKAIYGKPTANIILTGEKPESISSKIRNKIRMSILITVIQHNFGRASHGNMKRKIKGIHVGKAVKLLLFADDMIPYIKKNPQDATRKLLELTDEFGSYKIQN